MGSGGAADKLLRPTTGGRADLRATPKVMRGRTQELGHIVKLLRAEAT